MSRFSCARRFRIAIRPPALARVIFVAAVAILSVHPAVAQERLCDTQYENCRTPLLKYIQDEKVGLDVAFWFIEDSEVVTALINWHTNNPNVPMRVIVDQRANTSKPANEALINQLCAARIPMREKFAGYDILHFKMMLFHGQDIVEFSKANFTPESFVPIVANANYFDEAIYFTSDDKLTNSFRRRFDDLWVDTTDFRNYSSNNGTCASRPGTLARRYPSAVIDPSMNFVPLEDFGARAVSRYDAVKTGGEIDAMVYRVMDGRHSDAMIRAVQRGVTTRLITDPDEYRNPTRLWDAKEVDRMYMGGVQIKMGQHGGIVHEGAVVLHLPGLAGDGEVIFGSSNWTMAAAIYEDDHNYFYDPSLGKPWFFQWFADQFTRKWNDTRNYRTFVPLAPDPPVYSSPSNGASGVSSSVTLTWDGGTWAHLYDICVGITPEPPCIATDQEIGSPVAGTMETYAVTNLQPGMLYFWRIVSKTWAKQTANGPVWTFTTSGFNNTSQPYLGVPAPIPGTVQAENFDEGGLSIAYYDTTSGNKGGAYRQTDVDIGPTTDAGSGYYIGWTRAGEWLNYTVNVASTGIYSLETRVANVGTGATFHVDVDGVDKTGTITLPDTGSWTTFTTITTQGLSLTSGRHVLRVSLDTIGTGGAVGGLNWFRFTAGTTPPPSVPNTPYGGVAWPVPGIVQAEDFDDGGQSIAYNDTTSGNKGGAYRQTDVDIGPTTDAGGGYYVGWTRAGEWLKYTVNVASAGTYSLDTRVANIGAGASFHVEVDDVARTGPITLPDTQAWDAFQTLTTSGLSLPAGQHVITIRLDTIGTGGAVGGLNWFRFTTGTTPPPSLPNTPYGGVAWRVPGIVQAENFDDGGQSIAYYDTTSGNKGGAYRQTDVDIGPTTDAGGGYYIGWTRAGEWLKYTVNIASAGTYSLDTRVANIGPGASFHVEVDGVARTGPIALPDTQAWDVFQTLTTPGLALPAGQHVITISLDAIGTGGAVGGLNWFRFTRTN